MTQPRSYLKGKHILAVDDEQDILESIEDILDEAHVDRARDYESASLIRKRSGTRGSKNIGRKNFYQAYGIQK